jgi:N-succinyldiaminopimelate aminotransferase
MAGARLRPVTLHPPGYRVDLDALAAAITPRTRVLLINSPHNPTGTVLTDAELGAIARLCIEHDLVAVTDEVYEHLVYDGEHRPLAAYPGMAGRTLTISSAGKTFSFTGWKVGWAVGPAPLVDAVRTAKQFLTYVNGAPFQHAVVVGLELGDDYYHGLRAELAAKREVLCAGLAAAGFDVYRPAGTYFVTVDVRPLGMEDGVALCRSLPERCGVVAVPNAVFYADPARGRHLVRFAFCKRTEVLAEAAERLAALRPG